MIQTNNPLIGELLEPKQIAFSFAAPGWKILALIILLLLISYGIYQLRLYFKNKYRRLALKEINTIYTNSDTQHNTIYNIVFLLKRVAITVYGKENVAKLNGKSMLFFLQQKTSKPQFTKASELMFEKHLYEGSKSNASKNHIEQFCIESINWIKKHHV